MGTTHLSGALEVKKLTTDELEITGGGSIVIVGPIAYGYQEELTDDTEKDVDTGLSTVDCVVACESVEATGDGSVAATKILASKSAAAGHITLQAIGATGTTKVNWIVIGEKSV